MVTERQLAAAQDANVKLSASVSALDTKVHETEAKLTKANVKAQAAEKLRDKSRDGFASKLAERRKENGKLEADNAELRRQMDLLSTGRRTMEALVREAVAIETKELLAKHESELKVHPSTP